MTETPLQRYQRDLEKPGFIEDAAQGRAVESLQRLYHELAQKPPPRGWLKRLLARQTEPEVRGLYMWGGVGRGKTYLMDVFYDALPFEQKQRTHFHRFMRGVHADLRQLKGEKNPLEKVAERLSARTRVICFDEFFVSDIGDAMILGNLMRALFERGVVLVATSNVEPDRLYKDGLQRARFLPAIELLKQHCEVLRVDGGQDFRLRTLKLLQLFHVPADSESDRRMQDSFDRLLTDEAQLQSKGLLEIEGRGIGYRKMAEDIIWFDFDQICGGPRSTADYIEIAREFHTVLVSGVPCFRDMDDQARRFIHLVDEFYDRSVKLMLTAAMPMDQLYDSGRLSFEFQRTRSRLLEMQSTEYLAREHKA